MPILSSSPSARLSIIYITVGALIEAWSLIWLSWLRRHPPEGEWVMYVCYGMVFSGLIVFGIGASLGWIGRAARKAELPPSEVTREAARAEMLMAANPPAMVANPATPTYTANGQPVVPTTAVPAAPLAGQPVMQVRPS